MIKKIGLPLIALTAVLAFAAPKQADARVRFGVAIGGPVYAGQRLTCPTRTLLIIPTMRRTQRTSLLGRLCGPVGRSWIWIRWRLRRYGL